MHFQHQKKHWKYEHKKQCIEEVKQGSNEIRNENCEEGKAVVNCEETKAVINCEETKVVINCEEAKAVINCENSDMSVSDEICLSMLQDLCKQGYSVMDDFLTEEYCVVIRSEADCLLHAGRLTSLSSRIGV